MARVFAGLNLTVAGDIGTLDQITTGSQTPLTIAVVDASGNQITSFGGGTQYTGGTLAGQGDTGNALLVVRSNVLTGLKVSNGAYVQLRVDASGALWTRSNTTVITSVTTSTFAGIKVDIERATTSVLAGTKVDIERVTTSALAGIQVDIDTINQVDVAVNTGNASAGTQRVVLASDQPNVAVNIAAASTSVLAGTKVDIERVTTAVFAGVQVDIDTINQVDVAVNTGNASAGTQRVVLASDQPNVAVNISAATTSVLSGVRVAAEGVLPDDVAISGGLEPVPIGGRAVDYDGTAPGVITTEGNITRAIFDRNRRLYVNTAHPQFWSFHTDVAATATAIAGKSIQGAPAANTSIFVTDIIISTSAVTGGVEIVFLEGSTKVLGPYFFEAGVTGRGATIQFNTPKQITAATALTMTATRAGTVNCEYVVDVSGFVARVN